MNERTSGGTGPCHISTDPGGTHVFVANYGSGSTEVLPILADGSLGEPSCFVQHTGSSVDASRQEGPHAHCAIVDPSGNYALVCDLGLDKILVYKYDKAQGGTIDANRCRSRRRCAGEQRAASWLCSAKMVSMSIFCITEMKSTITAFNYDSNSGSLKEFQTVSNLPSGYTGNSSGAEIALSPDGRFIYGSNRGADSLSIFAVSPRDHTLSLIGHEATGGKIPRCFGIDPSGNSPLSPQTRNQTRWLYSSRKHQDRHAYSHWPNAGMSRARLRRLPKAGQVT